MKHLIGCTALAAAAALSAAACGDSAAEAALAPQSASFKVQKRDLRVTITEKGTLKTANQVLVRPKIPGQAKIVTLVDEGKQVEAGEILVELDRTDVLREVQDLENRVIALRGDFAAATAELEIQLSENSSDIRNTELKLRFAEIELERWRSGTDVEERARRDVRVTVATSELERAERRFAQMPDLQKEGFVTKEQVEEERIGVLKADSEVRLAALDRDNYAKFTSPKDREQREADLRDAGLEVERAKQRSAAREAQRRSAVERQKSELGNTEARLAERRETLANMTIRAPAPGLVVFGDARNPWEDRAVKVGETVYSGQAILTLPDLASMVVAVAIHEADIARVKPGQKAYITVETAREQAIEGRVAKIAPVAAQANMRWSDGVKRFNVDVTIDGDVRALQLKPGLSGKVEIVLDELKGVLGVPQQAVFSQRGKFHVFRRKSGSYERVAVEIDPGNTQYVVVKSGIAEGDELLLYDPESAGGASVSSEAAAPAQGDRAPEKRAPGRDGAKDAAPAGGANGGGANGAKGGGAGDRARKSQ